MTKKGDTLPKYDNCLTCNKKLIGRQRSFCSRKCKDKYGNINNPSYIRQKNRGIKRKLKLVESKGGCCEICGYNKNITALTFHHINPADKLFNLELRGIANNNWQKVLDELKKCQLLCHNCHHELHHPQFNLRELQKKFDIS